MGQLPKDRVHANRAFIITGTDFCGPFYYKSEIRNKSPIKCYVCLFICFATKAVHLELVKDLTTSAFLAALQRFISTRGKPKIICDSIEWKFIPPGSPHFGGLWEAAVKTAKYHFCRAVGLAVLDFDELRTLVCQIAAIINFRPLCPLSECPEDLDVLTPAHFLIGAPLTSIIEPDTTVLNVNRLDRWQRISYIQQIFWKRWSTEYLTQLQERSKRRRPTPNISLGAIVLLKDDNLLPFRWPLGRVIEVISGPDGVIRVATSIAKLDATDTSRAELEDQYVSPKILIMSQLQEEAHNASVLDATAIILTSTKKLPLLKSPTFSVMQKTDAITRRKWNESLNFDTLPSWEDCSKLLNRHYQFLESLDSGNGNQSSPQRKPHNLNS
ncbi:uncharacterized protein LOC119666104 [Teleopsis dalmanni]|uniref:uncharacterized protein LOC119666104 n=1 Tax=Teleopsis dalmanni TaxID=139649 RepID=UPI0018CDAB26|nr:uncharacterized protein LOC119666104 [Teleopsis dalmanni]